MTDLTELKSLSEEPSTQIRITRLENLIEKGKIPKDDLLRFLDLQIRKNQNKTWCDFCKLKQTEIMTGKNTKLLGDYKDGDYDEFLEIEDNNNHESALVDIREYLLWDSEKKKEWIYTQSRYPGRLKKNRDILLRLLEEEKDFSLMKPFYKVLGSVFNQNDPYLGKLLFLFENLLLRDQSTIHATIMSILNELVEEKETRRKILFWCKEHLSHSLIPVRQDCLAILYHAQPQETEQFIQAWITSLNSESIRNALWICEISPAFDTMIQRHKKELENQNPVQTQKTEQKVNTEPLQPLITDDDFFNPEDFSPTDPVLENPQKTSDKILKKSTKKHPNEDENPVVELVSRFPHAFIGSLLMNGVLLIVCALFMFFSLRSEQGSAIQELRNEKVMLGERVFELNLKIEKYEEEVKRLKTIEVRPFEEVVNSYLDARKADNTLTWKNAMGALEEFLLKYPFSQDKPKALDYLENTLHSLARHVFFEIDSKDYISPYPSHQEWLKRVVKNLFLLRKEGLRTQAITDLETSVNEKLVFLENYKKLYDQFYKDLDLREFERARSQLPGLKKYANQKSMDRLESDLSRQQMGNHADFIETLFTEAKRFRTQDEDDGNPFYFFNLYRAYNDSGLKSRSLQPLDNFLRFEPLKVILQEKNNFLFAISYLVSQNLEETALEFLTKCETYAASVDADTQGTQAQLLANVALGWMILKEDKKAIRTLEKTVLQTEFYDTNSWGIKAKTLLEILAVTTSFDREKAAKLLEVVDPKRFATLYSLVCIRMMDFDRPLEIVQAAPELDIPAVVGGYAKASRFEYAKRFLEFSDKIGEDKYLIRQKAYYEIAVAQISQNLLSQAIETATMMSGGSDDWPPDSVALREKLWMKIAFKKWEASDPSGAEKIFESAMESVKKEYSSIEKLAVQIYSLIEFARFKADCKDLEQADKFLTAALHLIGKIPDTEANLYGIKRPLFITLSSEFYRLKLKDSSRKTMEILSGYIQGFKENFIKKSEEHAEMAIALAMGGNPVLAKSELDQLEKSLGSERLSFLSDTYLRVAATYAGL